MLHRLTTRLLMPYGSIHQSPLHRLSSSKIIQNISSHQITSQLLNNIKIATNCTKIALKYSKCYLCRFGLFRYGLKVIYGMQDVDRMMSEIEGLFLKQCPIPKYGYLLKIFEFENKNVFSAFSMINCDKLTQLEEKQVLQFLTAVELVNLGFSLHHSIGKSQKLNLLTRTFLKLISKQLKDSYLVLGGDYFHIRGSILASQTKNILLSKILSQIQIDFCKYVHLTQNLKTKILTTGYDSVDIREVYNISVLKVSPIVKGLIAVDGITGKVGEGEGNREVYEIVGLLVLYRRDLENFMFNFKDIVKKYMEYRNSANRINFDSQQSLPYYIFFQGAQKNRIDISYLNTVTMMSKQIQFLENKLTDILGKDKANEIQRKMNYYHMIYS